MCRSEVGSVAAEHVDPLLPRVVHALRHDVGCIARPPTRHGDVRRGRARRVAQREVSPVDGVTLRTVNRRRVRKLDESLGVLGRYLTISTVAPQREAAVVTDAADDPGLAVRDLEL